MSGFFPKAQRLLTGDALLRAKSLLDGSTDPAQKLAILYGIWAGYYVGGLVAKQADAALEFLKEAERHQDAGARCVAHRILGTTYLTKGDFAAALPHLMLAIIAGRTKPARFTWRTKAN